MSTKKNSVKRKFLNHEISREIDQIGSLSIRSNDDSDCSTETVCDERETQIPSVKIFSRKTSKNKNKTDRNTTNSKFTFKSDSKGSTDTNTVPSVTIFNGKASENGEEDWSDTTSFVSCQEEFPDFEIEDYFQGSLFFKYEEIEEVGKIKKYVSKLYFSKAFFRYIKSAITRIEYETKTKITLGKLFGTGQYDSHHAPILITPNNTHIRGPNLSPKQAFAYNMRAAIKIEAILTENYDGLKSNFFIGIPTYTCDEVVTGEKEVIEELKEIYGPEMSFPIIREFENDPLQLDAENILYHHNVDYGNLTLLLVTIINNSQLEIVKDIIKMANRRFSSDRRMCKMFNENEFYDSKKDDFSIKMKGLQIKDYEFPKPNYFGAKFINDLSWLDIYANFISNRLAETNLRFRNYCYEDEGTRLLSQARGPRGPTINQPTNEGKSNKDGAAFLLQLKVEALEDDRKNFGLERSKVLQHLCKKFKNKSFGTIEVEKISLINRTNHKQIYDC